MVVLYSKIRDEIQTGDLLVWDKTKIDSFTDFLLFLYQKIFRKKYIHVAVALRLGDRLFIAEATPPAVRLFPISMCDDFILIQTSIFQRSYHTDILLKHIGKKYSLFDFFRNLLKLKNNKDEFYCSEMAAEYYNEIAYIVDDDVGLTPDILVEYILKTYEKETISVKIDRGNLNVI